LPAVTERQGSDAVIAALRRTGDEAQLTQVVAAVAGADRAFAGRLAELLIMRAPNARQRDSMLPVPAELDCRAEASLRAVAGGSHGRVDLRFDSPDRDFTLFVENKLHSGYGHEQLRRYSDALGDLPTEDRRTGLLSITRNVAGPGEPSAEKKRWLGSLRWKAILGALRELPVANLELRRQWQCFLDVVDEQGDFGMTTLDRDAVYGWASYLSTRGELEQLIDDLAPKALEHVKDALADRPAWDDVPSDSIAALATRGQQEKIPYPTQQTVQARFLIPVQEGWERLRIQFLGGYDVPYFTVEARRTGGAQLLAGHGDGHGKFAEADRRLAHLDRRFDSDSRTYWARVHAPDEWLEADEPVADALMRLIRDDVDARADSGMLDPDSGFQADLGLAPQDESPADEATA